MRRIAFALMGSLVILGGWTCSMPRYEFNWRTFRFERVGPRSRADAPAQTARQADANRRDAPSSSDSSPAAAGPMADVTAIAERGRLYRLYLVAGQADADIPPENVCVVRRAPLGKLAAVMSLLYPGEGPGGGRDVRHIIYRNREVWQYARQFASRLDEVGPAGQQSGGHQLWSDALDELYKTEFPRKVQPGPRLRIVGMLNRLANDPSADRDIRWAGSVIAAHLFTRYEPKDYQIADATLALAGEFVDSGTFQFMVIRYHQVRQLESRGMKSRARREAKQALQQSQAWRGTTCWEMMRLKIEGR